MLKGLFSRVVNLKREREREREIENRLLRDKESGLYVTAAEASKQFSAMTTRQFALRSHQLLGPSASSSKCHERMRMELEREGPQPHKENLVSLSLSNSNSKHDGKPEEVQRSRVSPSLAHLEDTLSPSLQKTPARLEDSGIVTPLLPTCIAPCKPKAWQDKHEGSNAISTMGASVGLLEDVGKDNMAGRDCHSNELAVETAFSSPFGKLKQERYLVSPNNLRHGRVDSHEPLRKRRQIALDQPRMSSSSLDTLNPSITTTTITTTTPPFARVIFSDGSDPENRHSLKVQMEGSKTLKSPLGKPKPEGGAGLEVNEQEGYFGSLIGEAMKQCTEMPTKASPAFATRECSPLMFLENEAGFENLLQQRFKMLQAFLKQCDEADRTEHLQALRSLSAIARSGHAVELETRSIQLTLEEGREMGRVKMLNVLGGRGGLQKNPQASGTTPTRPRLPAPGYVVSSKPL